MGRNKLEPSNHFTTVFARSTTLASPRGKPLIRSQRGADNPHFPQAAQESGCHASRPLPATDRHLIRSFDIANSIHAGVVAEDRRSFHIHGGGIRVARVINDGDVQPLSCRDAAGPACQVCVLIDRHRLKQSRRVLSGGRDDTGCPSIHLR